MPRLEGQGGSGLIMPPLTYPPSSGWTQLLGIKGYLATPLLVGSHWVSLSQSSPSPHTEVDSCVEGEACGHGLHGFLHP